MKRVWMPAVFGALLPASAWADTIGNDYYHHMGDWGAGMMGFGLMGLFWIAIAVLVIFAIKWLGQDHSPAARPGSQALDILRERLARGEIEVDEFEARKAALGK